ncbi:MAG: glutathione S-transferase family protein [Bradyrhizobiaceae bacterium]|nr:glutathione S-transferase family protein [Bradyrhizobiaceae bacterium]
MQLIHHRLCPHSRFIRVALAEYGIAPELVDEPVWERREEFLAVNPAGTTPVLIDDGITVPGAMVIAEYIDEKIGLERGNQRLMPGGLEARVETRRLTHWFNDKFFAEVTDYLVQEKIFKRHLPAAAGGGPPDSSAIRAARANIRYHLDYIGWLLRERNWLACERMTYADIAAAAHLSTADYLGDVPWDKNESAKNWYARMKSRPAFRPLLVEGLPGMSPPASYADLDF